MNIDSKGVEYDTREFRKLILAPVNLVEYVVPSSCETIVGGTSSSNSPFVLCSGNLKSVSFDVNSKLMLIQSYAFSGLSSLTKVDFSNCGELKKLSSYLFDESKALTTVILPPNLLYFDRFCFMLCTNLKSIDIPDSVLTLSYSMFYASGLTTINISKNSRMNKIENEALRTTRLTSFFVAKNVTKIDGSMFMGSTTIKEIIIHEDNHNFNQSGNAIYSADNTMLLLTYNLQKIVIPKTVTKLGYACFRGTTISEITFEGGSMESLSGWFCAENKVTCFSFPRGVNAIPNNAFAYNSKIVTVILTDEIRTISDEAFYHCYSLKNIVLIIVTTICSSAFNKCTSLEKIVLPASVTSIKTAAFSGCPKLIVDCSLNEEFSITDGMFFIEQKRTLSEFFGSSTLVTIPSSCSKVGRLAFYGKSIEKVVFENSNDITISSEAFSSSSIKEIVFPEKLVSIGDKCFEKCSQLTSVTFLECSLTYVPNYCFSECTRLTSINLPSTIVSIGQYAFYWCSSLTSLNLFDTNIETIGSNAFLLSGLVSCEFPGTLKTLSESSFSQSSLKVVNFESTMLYSIPSSCFYMCKSLYAFTFPSCVSTIEKLAFFGCESLEEITLPLGINVVGTSAFESCALLSVVSLTLNCYLTNIKGRAFANCPKLTKISVDPMDKKLIFDQGALTTANMSNLIFFLPTSSTSVYVIPALVQIIGPNAFEDCSNLKMVVIPEGNIKSIRYRAFAGCKKLSFICLPKSITEIAAQSFEGCKSLKCGSIYTSGSEEVKNMLLSVGVNSIAFSTTCVSSNTQRKCTRSSRNYSLFLVFLFLQ